MRLGLRLLFGYLLVTGLAAFFLLRVFMVEIKPSVRDVMEDILVDTANLLAETAAADLAALPPGGTLDAAHSPFAQAVMAYGSRPIDAKIWGLQKRTLDFRVYLTDAAGRVVFDSGPVPALGEDYSRWRDVARTLRGEYGARASPDDDSDNGGNVMYVAAPVRRAGQTIGVLTVAKPSSSVARFIARAERKVLTAGVLLLGLSLLVGVAVTAWTVHSVRRLRRYAQQVGTDDLQPGAVPPAPPQLPGELGDLAQAMDRMRARLEGREHLEHTVRALTHELKGPITAIHGAAELLHDELPAADRQRFSAQIDQQAQRMNDLVEQMLALSKLESLRGLPDQQPVPLLALTEQVLGQHAARLEQRGLRLHWLQRDGTPVAGDAQRLALALSNLLVNAMAWAPPNSVLDLCIQPLAAPPRLHWSLRDRGPGVPDYALPQLGQRFFSTAEPASGRKGSGLGLAIVRQVVALHGGQLRFEPAQPGLRVVIELPLA